MEGVIYGPISHIDMSLIHTIYKGKIKNRHELLTLEFHYGRYLYYNTRTPHAGTAMNHTIIYHNIDSITLRHVQLTSIELSV